MHCMQSSCSTAQLQHAHSQPETDSQTDRQRQETETREMPHLAGLPGLCLADEAGSASPGLDCTKLHKLPGQMALAEVGGLASMLSGAHALETALREPVTQLLVRMRAVSQARLCSSTEKFASHSNKCSRSHHALSWWPACLLLMAAQHCCLQTCLTESVSATESAMLHAGAMPVSQCPT